MTFAYDEELLSAVEQAMQEPTKEETELELALVGFRTMKPDTQRAFLVGAMDEYVSLAKQQMVDPYLAGQLITRAQLIGSFILERKPGQLKVIRNG